MSTMTNDNTNTTTLANQLTSRITSEGSKPAKDFQLNPLNFRGHPDIQHQAAQESLNTLGWIQRVIINKTTGNLIDGELRVLRAQAISPNEHVPFIEVELSPEEEKIALLYLDPISGMASIKENQLLALIQEAKPLMPETSPVQDWLMHELKLQKKNQEPKPYQTKDSEINNNKAEEYNQKWQAISGSLFQIGQHKLLCADSTIPANLTLLMDAKTAAISFTSPPYNASINVDIRKEKKTPKYLNDTDHKSNQQYTDFLQASLDTTLPHTQFAIINIQILTDNKKALFQFINNNVDKLADVLIWDKVWGQPAIYPNVTNSQYELILVFSHSGKRTIGTKPFHGSLPNIYSQSRNQGNNPFHLIHKAIFPTHLPMHFISNLTNEADIVLEPFSGLGTTIIAAQNTERICYAIESEPLYVATSLERFHTTFPNIHIKKLN